MVDKILKPEEDSLLSWISDEDFYKLIGIKRIPYPSYLSFEPLIKKLEEKHRFKNFAEKLLSGEISKRLSADPALRKPIKNMKVLESNEELVHLLMSLVLPPVLRENQLIRISAPFDLNSVYYSPALQELKKNNRVKAHINGANEAIFCATVVSACCFILNKFYGQNIHVEPPFSLEVEMAGSGIRRHFKTELDMSFVDIKKTKPLLPLHQDQIYHLLSNIYDVDLWLEHLPPENFEFHGFFIGNLIEITTEEALSQLRLRLLRKNAMVDQENVSGLEHLVRTYLGIPSLRLGLLAIDYPFERSVGHHHQIRYGLLARSTKKNSGSGEVERGSIYDKVCRYKETLLIENLEQLQQKTRIERDLLAEGIRSIMVAPLFNKKEEIIGLLEIGSEKPFDLHSFIELKFQELSSLFSLAVERSREEVDNQIEAVIREQFTAIHPSVEWKFVDAAYKLLLAREHHQDQALIEPVVFPDVFPLYGQADIVGSSDHRNGAIQDDLIDNLQRVQKVMRHILEVVHFPLLRHLQLKVERSLQELRREFSSSDESRIVDLLHSEIHPLLKHLEISHPEISGIASNYFSYLDADLQIVYRKRKAYEDSVGIINNVIAKYLDQQDREMQKVIPHYFEKYKTDGVEYDVYVGQSMLQQGIFSMMHLRNLRLWQMIIMCEITRKVQRLQSKLPVSLLTAQLIFAYTAPLSIRFHMDEKQFDVDGAYNVRYEILKKRIDKATVEGTEERLTVAGKIAIVYLHEKDRQEYLEYIDYLQHEGYITDQVEDLRLARLQSVQGLRALRVTVSLPREEDK